MNKLFGVLMVFLLVSCATQKRCNQKFPPKETKDSVYIETVQKVPVYIPGDTVNVSVPIKCPDQDLVSIENQKLKQVIKILNGKLVSNTEIKDQIDTVEIIKTKTIVKEVRVSEPVKYVPKIYKYALCVCIAFVFWIGFKLYKFLL